MTAPELLQTQLDDALTRAKNYATQMVLKDHQIEALQRTLAERTQEVIHFQEQLTTQNTSAPPAKLEAEPEGKGKTVGAIMTETSKTVSDPDSTMEKAGFIEAITELGQTHVAPGIKIGSATLLAKQIVGLTRTAIRETMGPKSSKKWIAVLDSRIGYQAACVAIPGALWLGARMFPQQMPESKRIRKVCGYAVTGTSSETFQYIFKRYAGLLAKVARLADEVPAELIEDDEAPLNGSSRQATASYRA